MARYKNPNEELEMLEDEQEEKIEKVLKEEPKTPEEETWAQRYANLRRHQQEKENSLQKEIENLNRQIEGIKEGKIRPPKTASELQEWEEEYPDFAQLMDVKIKRAIQESTEDLRTQAVSVKREKAFMLLVKEHPDCGAIFKDAAFHDWMKTRSTLEQKAVFDGFEDLKTDAAVKERVKNAAFVLEKWKAVAKKKKKPVDGVDDGNTDAARSVRTRSSVEVNGDMGDYDFSESQIKRESDAWYDKNEAKIREAQRKGRILYDISGAM